MKQIADQSFAAPGEPLPEAFSTQEDAHVSIAPAAVEPVAVDLVGGGTPDTVPGMVGASIQPEQAGAQAPPPNALPATLWGIDLKAAAICCIAAAAYTLSHFEGSVEFFLRVVGPHFARTRFADMSGDLYWLFASNVLFGLIPFAMLFVLREPRREYGLGLGDRRIGLRVTALFLGVMLPITYAVSRLPSFHSTYPLNGNAAKNWPHFLVWETLYLGYFVGWEFFHRSFLLVGLRRRIGNLAIFVVAIPFTLEHYGKPEPEAWGSFVAAIALGILAVRARSFWYGVAIHGGVALFMDVTQSWKRLFHH